MEGLAPPLQCLIEMHAAIKNGEPARIGAGRFLQLHPIGHSGGQSDRFARDLRRFFFAWDQGQDWRVVIAEVQSPYRRALLDILAVSLAGQPILGHLEELKDEITQAADSEIKHHLELLPIKMLPPLLFCQFPAFLILLFGPLFQHLLRELAR